MKVGLVFSGERAAKRFEVINRGFIMGQAKAAQREQQGNIADLRNVAAVLDAFKSISVEAPATDATNGEKPMILDQPDRVLDGDARAILLTVDQRNLVKKYIEGVNWFASAAADVVDAVDFLSNAKEVADTATADSLLPKPEAPREFPRAVDEPKPIASPEPEPATV